MKMISHRSMMMAMAMNQCDRAFFYHYSLNAVPHELLKLNIFYIYEIKNCKLIGMENIDVKISERRVMCVCVCVRARGFSKARKTSV